MNSRTIVLLVVAFCMKAQEVSTPVSVFLVAAEPPAPDVAEGDVIGQHAAPFESEWKAKGVRILNLEAPLKSRLDGRNVEYATSNWSLIRGQVETLSALARFAAAAKVGISVRFVSWEEAFQSLLDSGPGGPDVAQVGTTWTAHFVKRGGYPKALSAYRGNWRDVAGVRAVALPYLTDIRVIFYWKHMPFPGAVDSLPATGANWRQIVTEIGHGGQAYDHLAFPVVLSPNLLHNLASLVGSEQRPFIAEGFGGPSVDFKTSQNLELLTSEVRDARIANRPSAVNFPELSYYELSRRFMEGEHRAVIDRLGFLTVWKRQFRDRWQSVSTPKTFWDYAAIAVPPRPFHGGSELLVLRGNSKAFDLADFLATDKTYTDALALAGHLPSWHPDEALAGLFAGAKADDSAELLAAVRNILPRGKDLTEGRTYPDLEEFPSIEATGQQEQLQRLWRRMADGDDSATSAAAREAQNAINSKINRVSRAWVALTQPATYLGVAVAMGFGAILWMRFRFAKSQIRLREQIARSAILTSIAYEHGVKGGGIQGGLMTGLVRLLDRRPSGTADEIRTMILKHAGDVRNTFLLPLMMQIERHLHESNSTEASVEPALNVAVAAFNLATARFNALFAEPAPYCDFRTSGLDGWIIPSRPAAIAVCFWEYFYNSVKHIYSLPEGSAGWIEVRAIGDGVRVRSPGSLTPTERASFEKGTGGVTYFPELRGGLAIVSEARFLHFWKAAANPG